jgi:hypothetical protein
MGDGHLNKCIACTKADVTAHRVANIERVRAYDRSRSSMPHRMAARKDYQQTPEGRAAHQRALKASALKYPERAKARIKFRNAVRDGKVAVWPICAVPDCQGHPEGHHPDYSAPLAVVWLCNAHHREAHKASEELEAA